MCVSELCVRETAGQEEEEEEDRTGVHNKKQAPHTKMWGTQVWPKDGCRTLNRAIASPVKS